MSEGDFVGADSAKDPEINSVYSLESSELRALFLMLNMKCTLMTAWIYSNLKTKLDY